MPRVAIAIDGKQVTRVSDELSGDDSNPDTIGPIRVRLTAGTQQLTFTRSGSVFAPGAVALARLSRIFLTPRGNGTEGGLVVASAANWRALCDRRLEWVEAIRG
jgi:hypothetical protein